MIHTVRWANSLSELGIKVYVISQHEALVDSYDKSVELFIYPNKGIVGYYLLACEVKKLIKELNPDVINAHYASGYGTTLRLLKFKNSLLSVWGSDIYTFPFKSLFHKYYLVKNLIAPKYIASTSNDMAKVTQSLTKKKLDITITPFGVEVDKFNRSHFNDSREDSGKIIVGTVKTLSDTYGIDLLINSFNLVLSYYFEKDIEVYNSLELHIYGDGPKAKKYKDLVSTLGIESKVYFGGRVNHDLVPKALSTLDIYVALSRVESFGVAVIEASAMKLPVVVSDVGGLTEVVLSDKTGIIVPKEDFGLASKAMIKLIENIEFRNELGENGRNFVLREFAWQKNVNVMVQLYKKIINNG